MLDSLLTLLAAKAKVAALVAGTALTTTAAVGGGTVVLQSVNGSPALGSAAVSVSDTATPTVGIGTGNGKGQGAQHRSDTATAVLEDKDLPAETVVFTCDPTRNHGQNVSAYVHSLPKGPGRGQLVSQAARNDCGKPVDEADSGAELEGAATGSEAAEVEVEVEVEQAKTPRPDKVPGKVPDKVKAAEPAETERSAKVDKPAEPARAERPATTEKPARADKAGPQRDSSGKVKGGRE